MRLLSIVLIQSFTQTGLKCIDGLIEFVGECNLIEFLQDCLVAALTHTVGLRRFLPWFWYVRCHRMAGQAR
jgi:hypothetical protein